MKICFSFRGNSYGPWIPKKCDSILIFTSFHNKDCREIAYFNTKMSYLSDFKNTKSKTLRTASRRMTNWTKPSCDPVQILRTKDWYFKSLIVVNTATSYFFTTLHVIYFWGENSTEGCPKLKSLEKRQVQEGLVSTLDHPRVPKWDRTS